VVGSKLILSLFYFEICFLSKESNNTSFKQFGDLFVILQSIVEKIFGRFITHEESEL